MGLVKKFDVDVIVFDLDGTLIDSKVDIADSLNHTFGQLGYDPLPMELIETFVGNGVAPLIHRAVVAAGHPERESDVMAMFRARYYDHLLDTTRPFDEVTETLEKLSGEYRMGLITNKPERFTIKILDGLNLARFFDGAVYGGDTLPVKKPDPASFLEIMDKYGVSPMRGMIVGDSAVDIHTGRNAGAHTIGVTYGFRDAKELTDAGADLLIDRFGDLPDALERA